MKNLMYLLIVTFIALINFSCGGSDTSSIPSAVAGDNTSTTGVYSDLDGQTLSKAMLADVVITPPVGYCTPGVSHCARVHVISDNNLIIAEQWRGHESSDTDTLEFLSYDVNGNLLESVFTDTTTNQVLTTKTYTYNQNDNLTKIVTAQLISINSTDTHITSDEFFYNSLNRLERKLITNDNGTQETISSYSGNERFDEKTNRDSDGNITFTSSYTVTLDDNENIIETSSGRTVYNLKGDIVDRYSIIPSGTSHTHYIYNGEGVLVRTEFDFTDADGIVDKVTQYEYDVRDLTGDGVIDVVITYNKAGGITGSSVGDVDNSLLSDESNVSGESSGVCTSLCWNHDSSGSCSNCGNMQGEVNRLLLGG